MPFVSRAQHEKFRELLKLGQIKQAVFDEWLKATPNRKTLPERVKKK